MDGKKVGNLLYERELIKLSDTYLGEEPLLDDPKEKFIYRLGGLGGVEGRTSVECYFESLEAAVLKSLKDTWNDWFKLSRLKLSIDGEIKVLECGANVNISCLRDCWRDKLLPPGNVPEFDYDTLPSMKTVLSGIKSTKQDDVKVKQIGKNFKI